MIDTAAFTGRIEFAPSFAPRPGISHVLFDFDGTLSLIRQGWPEVMVPLFAELLPPLPGETEADRRRLAFEDIMRLNGKQTIYQMIQLAERIRERGGTPGDPSSTSASTSAAWTRASLTARPVCAGARCVRTTCWSLGRGCCWRS